MISGVGIFALMVATFAKRRLQKAESRLSSTKSPINLSGQETKTAIITKLNGIETLSDEDFDRLIVELKSLRITLLEGSKILKCPKCAIVYHNKSKFCSNCGFALNKT
jgi:hypothetical protein